MTRPLNGANFSPPCQKKSGVPAPAPVSAIPPAFSEASTFVDLTGDLVRLLGADLFEIRTIVSPESPPYTREALSVFLSTLKEHGIFSVVPLVLTGPDLRDESAPGLRDGRAT